MQMDLADTPVLLFRNRSHGSLNSSIAATTATSAGSIPPSEARLGSRAERTRERWKFSSC